MIEPSDMFPLEWRCAGMTTRRWLGEIKPCRRLIFRTTSTGSWLIETVCSRCGHLNLFRHQPST